MQNIDYGKIMRNPKPEKPSSSGNSRWNIYGSLLIIGFTFGVISGIFYEKNISGKESASGLLAQSHTETPEFRNIGQEEPSGGEPEREPETTASQNDPDDAGEIDDSVKVNHHEEKIDSVKRKTETREKAKPSPLLDEKAKYVIFAKKYADKKKAFYDGSQLKKAGYPAFLVKSGDKIKVYVGPLGGKEEAYYYLANLKKIEQYKNAILYKK